MPRLKQILVVGLAAVWLLTGLGAGVSAVTQAANGHAGFFWFDSRKISDSGEMFYGAYAYRRLLPAFAPAKRAGDFAFFDGDFLPQVRLDIPHESGQSTIAGRARELGSLAYVIAVYAYQSPAPFRDVDAALRASGMTGYIGLTSRPPMTVQEFVELTKTMSLPVAMKQEGTTLRIVSFDFMSEAELKKLGYQPLYVRR